MIDGAEREGALPVQPIDKQPIDKQSDAEVYDLNDVTSDDEGSGRHVLASENGQVSVGNTEGAVHDGEPPQHLALPLCTDVNAAKSATIHGDDDVVPGAWYRRPCCLIGKDGSGFECSKEYKHSGQCAPRTLLNGPRRTTHDTTEATMHLTSSPQKKQCHGKRKKSLPQQQANGLDMLCSACIITWGSCVLAPWYKDGRSAADYYLGVVVGVDTRDRTVSIHFYDHDHAFNMPIDKVKTTSKTVIFNDIDCPCCQLLRTCQTTGNWEWRRKDTDSTCGPKSVSYHTYHGADGPPNQ